MKGGYLPKETDHAGRTYRGRVDVPLQNITDARDLLLTLRHEVLGHYGANTFAPGEKRALLDGLIAAREEPSLKPLWDDIDVRYAGRSLDVRAEEVYSLQCEGIEPSHHIGTDRAQRGQQAFQETCVASVRLMRADDLQSIACMVAHGLHDRSRTQQYFPTADELLKRKGMTMELNRPIQETEAAALASHGKAVESTAAQHASGAALSDEPDNAQLRTQLRGVEGVAADLKNRLRSEPGATPEDTRSELLQDGQDKTLRSNLRGEPSVSPEDTHSELLAAAAKEQRKSQEAEAVRQDREAKARGWTEEQAKARAARDVVDHADLVALGKRGDGDSFYLRSDMAMQASVNPAYDAALKAAAPELYTRVQENEKENVKVDLTAFHAAAAKGEAVTPVELAAQSQAAAIGQGLKDQLDDDLRRRKAREQELAGQGLNSVDVQRSGKELERGEFIMPRRIMQAYTEVEGKFFAKNSARVMFQDKGAQLATSTTDKETIADMVAYARAKQWDSLKLAGSQEFRREAWLQAESQGIRTQGYTPKTADLAALQALTQERSTNAITPLQERKRDVAPVVAPEVQAPRHDLTKNQAVMHAQAVKNLTINMQELQKRPGMENAAVEDLSKLAYWRGMVREENKAQPQTVQDEAVARFDAQATDPQFLKRLNQETSASVEDKTTDRARTQQRDTHEQSL
jgi:hypothetical protein